MAVISDALADGVIDIIRDRIASILLDELRNQASISSRPFLNISRIWKERETPFNKSELDPIAINLQAGEIVYGDQYQTQRVKEITYYIDIYTCQKHSTEGYADRLAVEQGFDVVNAVQFILDHPEYKALRIAPRIRNAKVSRVQRGEASLGDSGKGSIIRIEYTVTTHTNQSKTDPTTIEGNDTTVSIGTSNEGLFYQINF